MTFLGDNFRERAEKQTAAAKEFFEAPDFKSNPKAQTSAVICKVTANMLHVMGEMVDYLRGSEALDASAVRRKQIADRMAGFRDAYTAGVSSGDFTNFDRLTDDLVAIIGGSNGES